MSGIDDKNNAAMKPILAEKPYISKSKQLYSRATGYFYHDIDGILTSKVTTNRCLELDYLAVHPDNKGKGIGTALVESGVRFAEKIGVPIFTMAFKAGRGIYARLGFQEVDRVIQDNSQFGGAGEYGAYFMIYNI